MAQRGWGVEAGFKGAEVLRQLQRGRGVEAGCKEAGVCEAGLCKAGSKKAEVLRQVA